MPSALFGRGRENRQVTVAALIILGVILLGVWAYSHASQSTSRKLSVTVNAPNISGSTVTVADTHEANACVGQVGTDVPQNQCAATNDQGVAEIPVDKLSPGSYGIIVFCKGQQRGYWTTVAYSRIPLQVNVPQQGDPAAQTVTLNSCGS